MRWLAVHLPMLPLEVLGRGGAGEVPLAVVVRRQGERILRCNAPALALGVRPGMALGAARALCAGLVVRTLNPGAEREALERLAAWALGFTPLVSLVPPRALLLDVGASLRLFGGPRPLLARVRDGLAGLGYQGRLALAPTPLGALVLAVQGGVGVQEPPVVPDAATLRAALADLPLGALGLRQREWEDLAALGLRRAGELLCLPVQGLRERLGPRRVDWLARLLGETPDPRPPFVPPARYRGSLELPAEVELTEALLFPCRRLLVELGGLLTGRQAGVEQLHWDLDHGRGPETRLTLGSARPLADPERWLDLLRARLERLELPAPVRALALTADGFRPLTPVCGDLFPDLKPPAQAPDPALLDRLRARLGPAAVRGLALAADHRPELAWRWAEPGESGPGLPRADRPLWLLPNPEPLAERDGRPWLEGALELGPERERIDTG